MRAGWPLLTVILAVSVLGGCITGSTSSMEEEVFVSTYPLYFFTTRIVQDEVPVIAMVPSGVASVDWEPGLAEAIRAAEAPLVILTGAGLEPWADPIVRHRAINGLPYVQAAEGVDLMVAGKYEADRHKDDDHEAADEDPYVWLDPLRAQVLVDNVLDGLVAAFPDKESLYTVRAEALKRALDGVHERYSIGLRQCESRQLFVAYNGFGYLDHRYNLYQRGLVAYDREADPTASRIIEMVGRLESLNGTAIFYDPTRDPRVAQVVARESGRSLFPLHPVESLGPEERALGMNYFNLVERNLENLRNGLRCV